MPDIWTYNREKVKRALLDSGAECEVEPRVITNRDPKWTCHINRDEPDEDGVIGYDIYIHSAADMLVAPKTLSLLVVLFGLGFLLGFLWRPRFIKIKSL